MDKPIKPNVDLPDSFGGVKNNFSTSKILNGYEKDVPDIFGGANINYMLDTLGKRQTYYDTLADYINALPIGKTITTDNNNKLTYADLRTDFSGLANIDLSNLTSTGENHFANKDLSNLTYTGETHFLNKTQISNCILYAPYGVMTYTSTSLTVKGGLTVLIPAGLNGDGSLKNIEYTLPADQTTPYIPYASTVQDRRHAIFLDTNGAITLNWAKGAYTIGAVAPTTFYAGSAIWYDTMNNVIKETNDNGATWTTKSYVFLGDLDVNLFSSTINLVKSNLPIRLFSKNADNEINI